MRGLGKLKNTEQSYRDFYLIRFLDRHGFLVIGSSLEWIQLDLGKVLYRKELEVCFWFLLSNKESFWVDLRQLYRNQLLTSWDILLFFFWNLRWPIRALDRLYYWWSTFCRSIIDESEWDERRGYLGHELFLEFGEGGACVE